MLQENTLSQPNLSNVQNEHNNAGLAEDPDLAELKDSRGPTSAEVITTPELVDNLRHPEAARRGTDKGPRSYSPATEQISNLSSSTARTYTARGEDNTTAIAEAPDLAELKDSQGPTSAEVITTPELVDNLRHPDAARRGTDKGPRSYSPATEQISNLSSSTARTYTARGEDNTTTIAEATDLAELKDSRGPTSAEISNLSSSTARTYTARGEDNTTTIAEAPDLAELKDSQGPTSAGSHNHTGTGGQPPASRCGQKRDGQRTSLLFPCHRTVIEPASSTKIIQNSANQLGGTTTMLNTCPKTRRKQHHCSRRSSRPGGAEGQPGPYQCGSHNHTGTGGQPPASRCGQKRDGQRTSLLLPCHRSVIEPASSTKIIQNSANQLSGTTTTLNTCPKTRRKQHHCSRRSSRPGGAEGQPGPYQCGSHNHTGTGGQPPASRCGQKRDGQRTSPYSPATDQLSSLPAPRRSSRIARTNSAVQQRCSTPVQKRGENNTTAVDEVPDLAELKDSRGPTSAEVITTPELVDNLRHPDAARRGTDKGPRSYSPATEQISNLSSSTARTYTARGEDNTTAIAEAPDLAELKDSRGPTSAEVITTPVLVDNLRHPDAARRGTDKGPRSYSPATDHGTTTMLNTCPKKRGENNTTAVDEVPDLAELKDSRGPTSAEVITTPEMVDNLRHPEAARRGTDKGPRSYSPATDQLSSLPAPRRSSRIARTNSAVQQRRSTPVQKRGENNTTAVDEVPDLAELKDSRGPTSAEVITTPELVDNLRHPDAARRGTDKGPRSYSPATEQISNLSSSTARTYTARGEDNTTAIAEAPDLAELKDSRGTTSAEVITTPVLVDNLRHPDAARRGTDKGPRSYSTATDQLSSLPAPRRSSRIARTNSAVQQRRSTPVQKRGENNTTAVDEVPDLAELKDSRGPTKCVTEDDQSPDLPWSGLVLSVNNTDDENEDQLFKVV
ncbi:hypothetical protein quinque_008551 [Culex quinquefasciatus]